MNIFYLDNCPEKSARAMVDKHIVKMPLESAQMLSTAHRLLDGNLTHASSPSGKKKVLYLLDGESWDFSTAENRFIINNQKCYMVAHAKHPSTVWTIDTLENYNWHVIFFEKMLAEYTNRYGKKHTCEKLLDFFKIPPKGIKSSRFYEPTPAMPEKYKSADSLVSYRKYYVGEKWKFAKWKHDEIPDWFFSTQKNTWFEDLEDIPNKRNILLQIQKKNNLPLDSRVFMYSRELALDANV